MGAYMNVVIHKRIGWGDFWVATILGKYEDTILYARSRAELITKLETLDHA
jgi:hypothetical protein